MNTNLINPLKTAHNLLASLYPNWKINVSCSYYSTMERECWSAALSHGTDTCDCCGSKLDVRQVNIALAYSFEDLLADIAARMELVKEGKHGKEI